MVAIDSLASLIGMRLRIARVDNVFEGVLGGFSNLVPRRGNDQYWMITTDEGEAIHFLPYDEWHISRALVRVRYEDDNASV